MPYYPIFVDLKKRPCLVIGGGAVAERKVESLLKYGARVTVISPDITAAIAELVRNKKVKHVSRRYKSGDVAGYFLAVSATDSKATNKKIHDEANSKGILLNVVDSPELCDFIVPSVISRGKLQVAVSTSGRFPTLSKALRGSLEASLPPEFETYVDILGAVRDKLLKNGMNYDKKLGIYDDLLASGLLHWIRVGERAKINRFLKETVGPGYTLGRLGVKLPETRKKPGKTAPKAAGKEKVQQKKHT